MFHHVNTVLLSAAGAVLALAWLVRRALWLRANTGTQIVYVPGRAVAPAEGWLSVHREAIVDDDTGVITISGPAEYEHEGTTERLTPGADLARVPERQLMMTTEDYRRLERHAERRAVRELADLFEPFDRMMTLGMNWLDASCEDTIARWLAEADPRDELAAWYEYASHELPIVEREFAYALLVS